MGGCPGARGPPLQMPPSSGAWWAASVLPCTGASLPAKSCFWALSATACATLRVSSGPQPSSPAARAGQEPHGHTAFGRWPAASSPRPFPLSQGSPRSQLLTPPPCRKVPPSAAAWRQSDLSSPVSGPGTPRVPAEKQGDMFPPGSPNAKWWQSWTLALLSASQACVRGT